MKTSFYTLLFTFFTLSLFAQQSTGTIKLETGKTVKISSLAKVLMIQEVMGQSMQTSTDFNSTASLDVKGKMTDHYNTVYTLQHILMNSSIMGKDNSFDSDRKEDMNGEMKEIGEEVNKPKDLMIDFAGVCKSASPEKPKPIEQTAVTNPMAALLGQANASDPSSAVQLIFMNIPVGSKAGSKWKDSTAAGELKTFWDYSLDSIENNIATISAKGKSHISSKMDLMGNETELHISSDITEKRKVNINSGIIVSLESSGNLSGTVDIMGMNIPVSGTMTNSLKTE